MTRLLAICACFLLLLSGCSRNASGNNDASASPTPPRHSVASLMVARSAVAPGSEVKLGIRFVTEKGWHIYWKNPGDSGEPPRIEWQLPAGATAGGLEWPTPVRLNNPAGTDYGYEGTTVLLTSLQIPAAAQPGAEIEVGGELRWLVCHDICVPQRASLKAPVRIAGAASPDDAVERQLESAAEHLPQPLPASFRPTVTNSADSFRLSMTPGEPVRQAEFFPGEQGQVDNGAPQELETHAGRLSLTLRKSEYLRREPERLRGVIILNGQHAYQLEAPIQGAPPKGSHAK